MLIKERTSVTNLMYHLVFVTKHRKSVFDTEDKRQQLGDELKRIAEQKEITIIQMEIANDHVDLLIQLPPKLAPSDVVKSLKGTSARWWFKEFPETKRQLWNGHLWSNSFYMSTVGNVSKEIVNNYIENQMKKKLNHSSQ